jgi:hypothetical protein
LEKLHPKAGDKCPINSRPQQLRILYKTEKTKNIIRGNIP